MTRRKTTRAGPSARSRPKPVPGAAAESAPFVPPYAPSWVDRMAAALERLPGPYWTPSLVAFLVYLALVAADLWRVGKPLSLEAVYSNSLPF